MWIGWECLGEEWHLLSRFGTLRTVPEHSKTLSYFRRDSWGHPPHAHSRRVRRLLPLPLLSSELDQGPVARIPLVQGPPWRWPASDGPREAQRSRPCPSSASPSHAAAARSEHRPHQDAHNNKHLREHVHTRADYEVQPQSGLGDRRPVPPLLAAAGQRSVPVLRDADDALLLGNDYGHIHHLLGPLDPLQQDRLAGQGLGLDLRRHQRRGRAGSAAAKRAVGRGWGNRSARGTRWNKDSGWSKRDAGDPRS